MTGKPDSGIVDRLRRGRVVFDGGMGSQLIARGLEAGHPPEEWNRAHPKTVQEIHRAYADAGAEVITTNSFGGTPARLSAHGLGNDVVTLNNAAVRLARVAAATTAAGTRPRLVAFSMGPTGRILPPVGDATERELESEFAAQLAGLSEPIDLVLIETVFDLREGLCALRAARRMVSVPIGVTLTFKRTPRGFFTEMGDHVAASFAKLESAGAAFVGANCTIASSDMVDLAREMRGATALPLLCQPNAGAPDIEGGKPVYRQRPDAFAGDAIRMFETGVNAVGGCCGTTPEFIDELVRRLSR